MPIVKKGEQHHWWPKSLSKLWCDCDGMVTRIETNGHKIRNRPSKFASIGNAHHLIYDGPWAHSVETEFNCADSSFPKFVELLNAMKQHGPISCISKLEKDFVSKEMADDFFQIFGECIASLIVRSPHFRNRIKIFVDKFADYEEKISNRDPLIAGNIGSSFVSASDVISRAGNKFVFHTDKSEFVFGDGMANNIGIGDAGIFAKGIVALTPNIAVGFLSPYGMFREGVWQVKLSNRDVSRINWYTQIYSKNYLFYKSKRPRLSGEFRCSKFLMNVENCIPLLDYCHYNLSAV